MNWRRLYFKGMFDFKDARGNVPLALSDIPLQPRCAIDFIYLPEPDPSVYQMR